MNGLAVSLFLFSLVQQSASAPATKPAASALNLQSNSLVDLHFYVRSLNENSPTTISPPYLSAVAAAARSCEEQLQGVTNWAILEAQLSTLETATAFVELSHNLPQEMTTRRGDRIPIRAAALPYAEALAAVEPQFLTQTWPAHRNAIERARQTWQTLVGEKESDCLADIRRAFGMRDSALQIPIYLVMLAPRPHAVTLRRRGGPACFVSCTEFQGTQFVEAVLHEAIHALETVTDDPDQVLSRLRARLVGADPQVLRDLPHTLMFAQAAATVSKRIDPKHIPYGESSSYYRRVAPVGEPAAAIWKAHLGGDKSLSETLDTLTTLGRSAVSRTSTAPATSPTDSKP